MTNTPTVPAGPKMPTECHECGWHASSGEPLCEHAQAEIEAAEEQYHNLCDQMMAAQQQVWACTICGTVHSEDPSVRPRLSRCSACDRQGRIELMSLKEAQEK